ncbi:uncharacterized protein SCODWIG_00922 [Saccharomycodes ludwigii]|uniref:DNA 3'-5' helicase n=1 Tax=Saccharomycodes ludwigii TaxID=36035 RepID=A0A376B3D0_9ASCO|nr:hypothetical protein SCDLUD_003674 [Saccharomycodes ludwigii]KAH3900675.1 hypothetical protein SCDLUD_003674 [Saccharomycodes ludwigii]SSD59161.1 uncharacterized protein SCODWIG_00922 [Saccharomycodes ludwigii]
MSSPLSFLSDLNESQRLAVEFDPDGVLQVIAGPGTGKTKVLISRVLYLLIIKEINPESIIITTFSNKAKEEILERLHNGLINTPINERSITVGTFHGICFSLLKKYGKNINVERFDVIQESDQDNIIKKAIADIPDQVLDRCNVYGRKVNLMEPKNNGEYGLSIRLVKKQISKLKNKAITFHDYQNSTDKDIPLEYFYSAYEEGLLRNEKIDFDDMLLYAYKLLKKINCIPKVKHVLVDEFQDTSVLQIQLMFLMARGSNVHSCGITAVGDPDQSIYLFREAMPNNFQEMANVCKLPVSNILLTENYRSTQKILHFSETLMNQQKKGRVNRVNLRAQFDLKFGPIYMNFPSLKAEALGIVAELIYLKSLSNGFKYNDFAILVRQNRQLIYIERALIDFRIPYRITKGRTFWEKKEVRTIMNLLRIVCSDHEPSAIKEVLLYPPRGLGVSGLAKISNRFMNAANAFEELKQSKNTLPRNGLKVVDGLIKSIEECREMLRVNLPTKDNLRLIFEKLYKDSQMEYLYLYHGDVRKADPKKEPDYQNVRHKNVLVVKEQLLEYVPSDELQTKNNEIESDIIDFLKATSQDSNPELAEEKISDATKQLDLASVSETSTHIPQNMADADNKSQLNIAYDKNFILDFIRSVSLFGSDTTESSATGLDSSDKVTLSTVHKAKGLEWSVVFVPGCSDGFIPSFFGDADDNDDDDDDDDDNNNNNNNNNNNDNVTASDNGKTDTGFSDDNKSFKYKITPEDLLDEERRVFYVALTRAKKYLYLSSIDFNEMSGMKLNKSEFLTNDFLKQCEPHQRIFDNIKCIKQFYESCDVPVDNPKFSFESLIEDYSLFLSNERTAFYWKKTPVFNKANINILENTGNQYLNDFTTAANIMDGFNKKKNMIKNNNNNNSTAKKSLLSSRKTLYTNTNSSFAPKTIDKKSSKTLIIPKAYAPKIVQREDSELDLLQPPTKICTSRKAIRSNVNKPTDNIYKRPMPLNLNVNKDNSAVEPFQSPTKNYALKSITVATGNNTTSDNVCKSPTKIFAPKPEDYYLRSPTKKKSYAPDKPKEIKLDDTTSSFTKEGEEEEESDNEVDVTAAEILHNPEELQIDESLILTDAASLAGKVLPVMNKKGKKKMGHIKEDGKCENASDAENLKTVNSRKKVTRGKIKKKRVLAPVGKDILSVLKKCQEKSKKIDTEYIELD